MDPVFVYLEYQECDDKSKFAFLADIFLNINGRKRLETTSWSYISIRKQTKNGHVESIKFGR